MTLLMRTVSTETAADNLLEEARYYDPDAWMYRNDDDEGGHYCICYHWPLETTDESETR